MNSISFLDLFNINLQRQTLTNKDASKTAKQLHRDFWYVCTWLFRERERDKERERERVRSQECFPVGIR